MKIHARTALLSAAAALLLATGGAQAQAPAAQPGAGTRNTPVQATKLARVDRKFIDDAASSGMFEVDVAQLAVAKASDLAVKNFASMLVDHHKAANEALVRIANARGVELPAVPKRALRRDIDKLGKKNGDEFDRAFVRNVGIEAHEKDIRLFEKARDHVKDPELKAFVDKTLPTLRDHLAAAEKLPQSGKNAATMGANKK